jgi:hypothetical protein
MAVIFGRVIPTAFLDDTESENEDERNDTVMSDSTKTLSTQFNTTVPPVKRKRSVSKPCNVKLRGEEAPNGVTFQIKSGKWKAAIQASKGKRVVLGSYFKSAEAASEALQEFMLDRLEKTVGALEYAFEENRITLTSSHINEDASTKKAILESRKRLNAGSKRKIYACETCQKAHFNIWDLQNHRLSHTTEKNHHCVCGKQYRYRCNLAAHTKRCGSV